MDNKRIYKKIIIVIVILSFLGSCKKEVKKTKIAPVKETPNYALLGKQKAMATKKVLGKNLKTAIAKKGTLAALQFCKALV